MTVKFEGLTIQGLCELAVETDEDRNSTARPVAVAMEVAEILAELIGRASDGEDWKYWHGEHLPWKTSKSDFLLKLYRSLPGVPHGQALEILAAQNLFQAGWLMLQAGVLNGLHQLPEPDPGRMLRCVAGNGAALIEAVPASSVAGLYVVAACDRINSPFARRWTWTISQSWWNVCDSLQRELEQYPPDSVQLFQAKPETAVLTPRPEPAAAD